MMTKSGGETLRNNAIAKIQREQPNLTRDEAYEVFKLKMRERASKGGKHIHPNKGFAHPNANPWAAGQKGGRISRKPKKVVE